MLRERVLKQIVHKFFIDLTLHFGSTVHEQDVTFALYIKYPGEVDKIGDIDETFIGIIDLFLYRKPFLILLTEVSLAVDHLIIEFSVVNLLELISFAVCFLEYVQCLYTFPSRFCEFSFLKWVRYHLLDPSDNVDHLFWWQLHNVPFKVNLSILVRIQTNVHALDYSLKISKVLYQI